MSGLFFFSDMPKDPQIIRARAVAMLDRRIRNIPLKQIASEFNVTVRTVERSLDYAKRAGLIVQFEDQILSELVPKAIDAFKTALDNGDIEVAKEVFKGTGFLLRPQEKVTPKGDPLGLNEDDTLELYIRKLRGGDDATALPAGRAPVIDVRSLPEGPTGATTPATSELGENRDENRQTNPSKDVGVSPVDEGSPSEPEANS